MNSDHQNENRPLNLTGACEIPQTDSETVSLTAALLRETTKMTGLQITSSGLKHSVCLLVD